MSLLPPNATPAELAAEQTIAEGTATPVPLHTLWNPATCPADALPWLAWAMSVDVWDSAWPEATKRAVIADSFGIHQVKGTVGAVKRALASVGYRTDLVEWFAQDPPAAAHTFRVDVAVTDRALGQDTYAEVLRLATAAKPVRSHLSGVRLASETRGRVWSGAVATSGAVIEVLPYQPGELESSALLHAAAAAWSIVTTTVYPEAA